MSQTLGTHSNVPEADVSSQVHNIEQLKAEIPIQVSLNVSGW
jgi:hypothetical protein